MFRHLFRMMWNKKKENFLLLTEMLISFLVLFSVFSMLVYYYHNYRKPMGFEHEQVWAAHFSNPINTTDKDSIKTFFELMKKNLKTIPGIDDVSYCSINIPFAQNSIVNNNVDWFLADENYKNVLQMELLEGRWFEQQDVVAKSKPVVINNSYREELFGKTPAVGKYIGENNERQVIGVVADTKFDGDYAAASKGIFNQPNASDIFEHMLIRVSPNSDVALEGKLYKTLAGFMKSSNIEIEHLTNKRKNINYFALVPMIILSIVCCFLIINVALGLFGVLWYNINKRKGEIGLRRAIGASGNVVSTQLVAEALILATISIILGVFLAVQFPLLNVFDLPAGVYITAIFLSVLFIYVLVLICSLYPGRQAASIFPAVALHED